MEIHGSDMTRYADRMKILFSRYREKKNSIDTIPYLKFLPSGKIFVWKISRSCFSALKKSFLLNSSKYKTKNA